MKIVIEMRQSPPKETKYKRKSIEQQVRECIECIECGNDSKVEWKLLNRTYAKLQKMRKTPRVRNLIKMIEPILAKHGQYGVPEREM